LKSPWLFAVLRRSGLPDLVRARIQRRMITIVVFHRLSAEAADRAFAFYGRAYDVIPLGRAIEAIRRRDPSLLPRRPLVITFDDGLRDHYGLLPAVRKHGLPITIFLCAGIIGTNRHFWFLHDGPSRRDPGWSSWSHTERLERLMEDGFRFETEYETRQALSREEIEEMRPYVDFQCHSMFHENLMTCSPAEERQAIVEAKDKLERDFGLPIIAFAYPSGDHRPDHYALLREAGYACALTNDPGFNSTGSDLLRLKRIEALGQCDTGTLNEFIVRSSGILILPKALFGAVRRSLGRRRVRH
jgi:peptidoglycan/xylan/chitin deacetylase (PgdA/CDA1 family)